MTIALRFFFVGILLFQISPASAEVSTGLDAQLLEATNLGTQPKTLDVEKVKTLLAEGANPSARDRAQRTPLFYLSRSFGYPFPLGSSEYEKHMQVITLLLEKGADVNAQDVAGDTPLYTGVRWAGYFSNYHQKPLNFNPYLDLLLSTGKLKIDLANFAGATPIRQALANNLGPLIERFLQLGADPKQVDIRGRSLLFTASNFKQFNSFLSYLEPEKQKELVLTPAKTGTTVLHIAIRNLDIEITKNVIEVFGANVNLKNVDDETPLDEASRWLNAKGISSEQRKKAEEIYQLLLNHGAKTPDKFSIVCDQRNLGALNLERLQKIMSKCKVTTIERVLELIPSSYLANNTLVYAPQGIQKGSEEFPRVILMGQDAKFIIGFGGSSDFEGFHSLEIIEYKDTGTKREFEFREILFDGKNPKISEKNPSRCLACHDSKNPRPNWDTFFLYPGFYGSEEGFLFPTEKQKFNKYLKHEKTGRYKYLLPQGDRVDHFVWGPQYNVGLRNYPFDFRLDSLYQNVMSSWFANQKKLKPYRFALLAALSCDDKIEEYLPQKTKDGFTKSSEVLYQENIRLSTEEFKGRLKRHMELIGGPPEGEFTYQFYTGKDYQTGRNNEKRRSSRLRYLVENQGLSLPKTMAFEQNEHFVFSNFLNLEFIMWKDLLNPKLAQDKRIFEIFEKYVNKKPYLLQPFGLFMENDYGEIADEEGVKELCPILKETSLKELGHLKNVSK
jgi:ankyrin repeat protein